MNRELKYVKKWLDADILALYIEKNNFVLFSLCSEKKITERIVLKFRCKKITRANHVKFLGGLLDEALCWIFHLIEPLCLENCLDLWAFFTNWGILFLKKC